MDAPHSAAQRGHKKVVVEFLERNEAFDARDRLFFVRASAALVLALYG